MVGEREGEWKGGREAGGEGGNENFFNLELSSTEFQSCVPTPKGKQTEDRHTEQKDKIYID